MGLGKYFVNEVRGRLRPMMEERKNKEAENTVDGLMAALTLGGIDNETLGSVLLMKATEMLVQHGYNEDTLLRMVSSAIELQRR
ncbi:hypothetical protein DFP90_102404 [Aestuariispira insulae]|uniref:Uncharacterized protein n=2 Tax=Aestuariispira insulae TaxID=1461337 RepID=A0A3D9HS92_9PROT|nr:hypothetical protein DFP90_102404 [Aestuariispira insulae]